MTLTAVEATNNIKVVPMKHLGQAGVWLSEIDFRYFINIETSFFGLKVIIKEKDFQINIYKGMQGIYKKMKFQRNIFKISTEVLAISFVFTFLYAFLYTFFKEKFS